MRDEIEAALAAAETLIYDNDRSNGVYTKEQRAIRHLIAAVRGLKARVEEHEDVITRSRLRCAEITHAE